MSEKEKSQKELYLKNQLIEKKNTVAENLRLMWSDILQGKKTLPDKQKIAR